MYEGLRLIQEAKCSLERDAAIMVPMFEDSLLNDHLIYSQDEDLESEELLDLINRIPETDDEAELEQLMDTDASFESTDDTMMISESTENELFTESISDIMKEIDKKKKESKSEKEAKQIKGLIDLDKSIDKANKTIKELLYGNKKVNDILIELKKDLNEYDLQFAVVVNKLTEMNEPRIAGQVKRLQMMYKDKTLTAIRKISNILITK